MKRRSRWFRNGGAPHRGWYKGIWCDSAWELAFLMWHLDHGVEIVRNTELFDYTLNKTLHYQPDFLVNGIYHEIKGVMDGRSRRKISQFRYPLVVIGFKEIQPYLKYARDTYGKDYYRLLEKPTFLMREEADEDEAEE